jgi:hypothetical protein
MGGTRKRMGGERPIGLHACPIGIRGRKPRGGTFIPMVRPLEPVGGSPPICLCVSPIGMSPRKPMGRT